MLVAESKELATIQKRDRRSTVVVQSTEREIVFFKDQVSGVNEVKAGTLESLVEELAPSQVSADTAFVKEFLQSYRAFLAPRELLPRLISRWLFLPRPGDPPPEQRLPLRPGVRLRVIK